MKKYIKNFDRWNTKKKLIDGRILPDDFFFLEREVWWASIGVNIGNEIDGKNNHYDRPIVILSKTSEETLWAVPITSTIKNGYGFHYITYKEGSGTALLEQIRFISAQRLIRLVGRIDEESFDIMKKKIEHLLHKQEIPL